MFGWVTLTSMFVTIYLLPFTLAMVLIFTFPISTVILAFIFQGERLNVFEYLAILFSFFGVILMTNPELIGIYKDSSD